MGEEDSAGSALQARGEWAVPLRTSKLLLGGALGPPRRSQLHQLGRL